MLQSSLPNMNVLEVYIVCRPYESYILLGNTQWGNRKWTFYPGHQSCQEARNSKINKSDLRPKRLLLELFRDYFFTCFYFSIVTANVIFLGFHLLEIIISLPILVYSGNCNEMVLVRSLWKVKNTEIQGSFKI